MSIVGVNFKGGPFAAAAAAAWDAAWTYQAARLRMYFPDPFKESK